MRLTILLLASLVVFAMNGLAHGGGLNKCGCHMNRKTNTCHCHRAPYGGCGPECYARSSETSDANANLPAELARPVEMRDDQATSDCAEYERQPARTEFKGVPRGLSTHSRGPGYPLDSARPARTMERAPKHKTLGGRAVGWVSGLSGSGARAHGVRNRGEP